MKFKAQIEGQEIEVTAGPDSVMLASGTFETGVTRPSEYRRVVQVGDKSYEVNICEKCLEGGVLVLEIAGDRVQVDISDVTKGGGAAAPKSKKAKKEAKHVEHGAGGVAAPMPGKIVNVLVQSGDEVAAGQVLVILEAMKMENELTATNDGVVKDVLVQKGDTVQGGQMLVAIE
jgi:glutaconyl-CoA/methylmalonyl-CoA decarboxylase subunit gamma